MSSVPPWQTKRWKVPVLNLKYPAQIGNMTTDKKSASSLQYTNFLCFLLFDLAIMIINDQNIEKLILKK